FLFTHLQPRYQNRAWVVADGDESGIRAIEKLIEKYATWPANHFRTWSEADFENYYPAAFAAAISNALSKGRREKRAAKKALLNEVKNYCDGDPDAAKQAFADSAAEVISFLQEIERSLFGTGQ